LEFSLQDLFGLYANHTVNLFTIIKKYKSWYSAYAKLLGSTMIYIGIAFHYFCIDAI